MTLIIGSGYLGQRLKNFFPNSISTNLPTDVKGDEIAFDLRETSISKLPDAEQLIITCSIEFLGPRATSVAEVLKQRYPKIILISSASSFIVDTPNSEINESTPLKDSTRVEAESHFSSFATILYCGLLWDQETRNPQKWLASSRIKNGNKLINFTNADTLPAICNHIFEHPQIPPGAYICTDSPAQTWQVLATKYHISLPSDTVDKRSKKLLSDKLKSFIPKKFFTSPF